MLHGREQVLRATERVQGTHMRLQLSSSQQHIQDKTRIAAILELQNY
jgi:hypothetical protein